jgi:hypothetical protein
MPELGAAVTIPGIKRGNETIRAGDICIENIHAAYESTGSSICNPVVSFDVDENAKITLLAGHDCGNC